MGSLVAYFSHEGQNSVNFDVKDIKKGHTRTVAEKIAAFTGADILRIQPAEAYPADYDECCKRAKAEADGSERPAINIPLESLDAYDTIYIGFPIWYRSYPRVIATFIDRFDFTGKKVRPFCTNEEGAFGMADMELEAAIRRRGGEMERGLAVRGSNVDSCDDALKRWLGL
ncbi:MAG: NAD(P)H-dependent oxidoreductase [Spirochaetales bacterium]|nr:NAD(P)H-dependent oxidoreductase [Spirochaetales bacterium]